MGDGNNEFPAIYEELNLEELELEEVSKTPDDKYGYVLKYFKNAQDKNCKCL